MAKRFPGEICIGGPIPRHLLNPLITAIVAERVSLDDDGRRPATRETLETAFDAGTVVRLCHDQACLGQFDALERFLVAHRIHFNRHSDARDEFDAELVCYRGRGAMPRVFPSNAAGEILIKPEDVRRILGSRRSTPEGKLMDIFVLVEPIEAAPLTPVQIVSPRSSSEHQHKASFHGRGTRHDSR
jgi:hypothetical protein